MKENIIFFANTLWFIEKFKYELIKKISNENNVTCIYLREGPPYNQSKIISLISSGKVKFFNFKDFILSIFSFKKYLLWKPNHRINYKNIVIFNIGPILISTLLPLYLKKNTVYVLEGLGRIFSSNFTSKILIKVIVIRLYKYLFNRCKLVYVLNSHDYLFLVENNICQINKIKTLPGTGINHNIIDKAINKNRKNLKYIDYIGRLITEKGYQKFILTKINFTKYHPKLDQKYIFRIICPNEEIKKIPKEEIDFLNKLNIQIKPYLVEPYSYYNESRALIVPSSYGEGLSRVVLEASYIGIPILASKIRGIEEILRNDYKYYIESNNPFCLSQQLAQMLRDSSYFRRINEKQKAYIKKNFSIKNSINTFISNLINN